MKRRRSDVLANYRRHLTLADPVDVDGVTFATVEVRALPTAAFKGKQRGPPLALHGLSVIAGGSLDVPDRMSARDIDSIGAAFGELCDQARSDAAPFMRAGR